MEQISNKIKVAWICHFSNQEVRERLPLSKRLFLNFLKSIIGKEKVAYRDFAPWINNLIKEFERFENIELNIIAPHQGLKTFIYDFEKDKIFYHFFKTEFSIILRIMMHFFFKKKEKKFFLNRFLVKRIIKQIKPDIINLIGTENPYYSITSLDIKDVPVYVSAQTVYSNPLRKIHSDTCDSFRWNLELKIHKKEKYFGCGGRMHRDLILKNNPEAIIFKNFFPIQKPPQVENFAKEYDFVFFAAGVTPKKGIEDAIEALTIVKEKKIDVTLNVVGTCLADYKEVLFQKIKQLNLDDNVSFNDYFPIHADMHRHIKKSRFALLPVKLDIISGTIIEAALLELPIVTYKTSGTPYLNKNGEAVLISEIGNIHDLANNMLKLIQNSDLAEKLKKNAKQFVETEFDNTESARRLVKNYKAVLDHYHNNKPIPNELLFNTEEFPIY